MPKLEFGVIVVTIKRPANNYDFAARITILTDDNRVYILNLTSLRVDWDTSTRTRLELHSLASPPDDVERGYIDFASGDYEIPACGCVYIGQRGKDSRLLQLQGTFNLASL